MNIYRSAKGILCNPLTAVNTHSFTDKPHWELRDKQHGVRTKTKTKTTTIIIEAFPCEFKDHPN